MGCGSKRGGTKVNGVKLKPVPVIPPSSAQLSASKGLKGKEKQRSNHRQFEEEEEGQDESRAFLESFRRERPPLAGCVVCFSGIADPVKSRAAEYAEKLGAAVEKALTLDVTHLICDRPGSQKYKVALEHDIKVMLPLWLETLYSSFTEGDDVAFDDITQRYTMKALHGLKLSMTGRSSSSRTPYIRMAEDNGASISMDLDISCSHLVVFSMVAVGDTDPSVFELEKVQAALKTANSIKVVWQEWLEDSVERGGCLPEADYMVQEGVPRPARSAYHKSSRTDRKSKEPRKVASACPGDESEPTVARKFTKSRSQNAMLASIILQEDIPLGPASQNHHFESPNIQTGYFIKAGAMLPLGACVDPRGALETSEDRPSSEKPQPLPLASAMNTTSTAHPVSVVRKLRSVRSEKFSHSLSRAQSQDPSHSASSPSIFQGLTISFASCPDALQRIMSKAVLEHGARITTIHSQADYTIVPHINPQAVPLQCNPVAHSWLEYCRFKSQVVDPDQHWGLRPLRLQSLPDGQDFLFTSCGFDDAESEIIKRTLSSMKLNYNECPRRSQVTHIFLGPDQSSSRVQKVKTWTDKLLVDFEWLVDMCDGKRILPLAIQHTLSADESRASPPPSTRSPTPVPLRKDSVPLAGCVLYMTKKGKLDEHSKCISGCRKLGAQVVDKLSDSVTHLIHVSDRVHDPMRELKIARAKNIFVVHPSWLTECQTKRVRVDELTFLPTYRPGKALQYGASGESGGADQTLPPKADCDQSNLSGVEQSFSAVLEENPALFPPSIPNLNDENVWQSTARTAESQNGSQSNPKPRSLCNDVELPIGRPSDVTGSMPTSPTTSDHFGTSASMMQEPRSDEFGVNGSSPSRRVGPGVDNQIGGLMQMLQNRNPFPENLKGLKNVDSRRSRKRLLGQTSEGSSASDPAKRCALTHCSRTSDRQSGGLHRTLSGFSHSSAATSQAGFLENEEESMRVTWDDPAAKCEILKVIKDPASRADRRLVDRSRAQSRADGWNPRMGSPRREIRRPDELNGGVSGNGECAGEAPGMVVGVNSSPLKRRKPRLIDIIDVD